jgi:hypothetical protein
MALTSWPRPRIALGPRGPSRCCAPAPGPGNHCRFRSLDQTNTPGSMLALHIGCGRFLRIVRTSRSLLRLRESTRLPIAHMCRAHGTPEAVREDKNLRARGTRRPRLRGRCSTNTRGSPRRSDNFWRTRDASRTRRTSRPKRTASRKTAGKCARWRTLSLRHRSA